MANLSMGQYAGSREPMHLPSYISGYFDGEGCFTVSISPRAKLRVGWETRPSVSVSQNGDRAEVLVAIADYFGCGSMRPDPGDKTLKWETRNICDIRSRVIPHFRRYPLRSGKQRDFELFARICEMIGEGQHLECDGLVEIIWLAARMNPSGKRRYEPEQVVSKVLEMKA